MAESDDKGDARPPGVLEVLDQIRRGQARSGYQPRTKEEIDADLAAMRDDWDRPPTGERHSPAGPCSSL